MDQKKQVEGPKQHSGYTWDPRPIKMGVLRSLVHIIYLTSRRLNGFEEHWDQLGVTLGSLLRSEGEFG